MEKQNSEIKLAKAILKEEPVGGMEVKFHHVDFVKKELAELIYTPANKGAFSYLIWNEKSQDFKLTNEWVIEKTGTRIIPPVKNERFIQDMLIPVVKDNKEFKAKIEKFDTKELDHRIDSFFKKWFILPEEYILAFRLFIKFSWVQEQSYMMPYLSLWGDRGTGKTMVGIFLSWLCRFPYFNKGGATPAVLARSLDLIRGIAILDESDMYLSNNEETASFMRIMRGYHADATYDVVDEKRKTKFPKRFNVGFPKVILSAKPLKDDHLSSRCIILELKPAKVPPEMIRDTKNYFWEDLKKEAQEIVNMLLIFRLKNIFDNTSTKTIVSGVEPRYNDVAMPLFYMIDDEAEHKIFYDLVIKNIEVDLSQREETNEGQILVSLKKLIEQAEEGQLIRGIPRIFLEDLVVEVKQSFYSDSNERDIAKFINSKKLGWTLKGLGVKTKRDGNNQGKKFVDPDSFDDLPALYSRFGVRNEAVNEPNLDELLTKEQIGSIMDVENNNKNE